MRCINQKEKQRQRINFLRKKAFQNPYSVIAGRTQNDIKTYKQAKSLLNSRIIQAAYPLSDQDIANKDFHNCVKIKHLVGLFTYENGAPYWFRSASIRTLLNIFEKWETQAKNLNTEYYLKLWVFEYEFNESQVVFGLNSKAKRYSNFYNKKCLNQSMPFLTHELINKLQKFDISYCKDWFPLTSDDLAEMKSHEFASMARKMGYKIDTELFVTRKPALEMIDSFIEAGFVEKEEYEDDDVYLCHSDNIWVVERAG